MIGCKKKGFNNFICKQLIQSSESIKNRSYYRMKSIAETLRFLKCLGEDLYHIRF